MGISDLLAKQEAENLRTRGMNEANWQEGKGMLTGVQGRAAADPMTSGARGLAQGLIDSPESLDDETFGKILNRNRTQVDAQSNAMMQQGRNQLAASGQLTTGNLQALNDRVARNRIAGLTQAQTDLGIARADRRTGDISNAIGLARGLGQDRSNLDMGVAQTFLQSTPQYRPDDYSGWAALADYGGSGNWMQGLSSFGGGGGGGGRRDSGPSFMGFGGTPAMTTRSGYRGMRGVRTPDHATGGMGMGWTTDPRTGQRKYQAM
jgi:hypothetical protein